MKPIMLTLFMMIAVGVFALAEDRSPNPQTSPTPQVFNLLRTDGAGANVNTVELAAGAVDARESHLAAQVVVYVLEGTGTLAVDDKPPVPLKPGTVVQVAPTNLQVLTNTSLTQTLKVLVVDLVETGQPRVVLANGGTRQQKEAYQQKECEVVPNGDLSQHKTRVQDSTMKGLVF